MFQVIYDYYLIDSPFHIFKATPVEYGHVFLVPCAAQPLLDAISLEMFTSVAVEVNNCSFRLFYDCQGSSTSFLYFQVIIESLSDCCLHDFLFISCSLNACDVHTIS